MPELIKPATPIKNVTVICPTYRAPNAQNAVRLLGPVSLLEQMASQDFEGNINVVVVDSSPTPHPFFKDSHPTSPLPYLYLHVRSRNAVPEPLKTRFPKAMSFIPTDKQLAKSPEWQKLFEEGKAWDSFHPWDANYPCPTTMEEQMRDDRPTIGMKRNVAIAAAVEAFGAPDLIVHADDDDFRSNAYVRVLAQGIGPNQFTRMNHYLTYTKSNGQTDYGRNHIDFTRMANGYWLPPQDALGKAFYNPTARKTGYSMTIGQKLSSLKCLALPPISWEGALHAYRYPLWEKAVSSFGGIPITSMCEDIFFYLKCQRAFGDSFSADFTKTANPHLLRTGYGDNASVIEWTENVTLQDLPDWAMENIQTIERSEE
jgi:hypothetical protein